MKRIYFIILFILIIFASGNTYADIDYTIKKGDNPSKIAKKFKVSVKDIIKANSLNPHTLKPGTKIVIPMPEKKQDVKTAKKRSKTLPIDTTPIKTTEVTDKSLYHTVKNGDTLSAVSKKYSLSVNELKEINNLKSTKLRLGQKIFLEPEGELDELNATFSHVRTDEEIKNIAESKELGEMGLQERIILFAKKLLNIPYRFGGSSLMGIDCSAYVQKVYGLLGIDLPRSAREQFHIGETIDKDDLSIGDLVFFRTYASFPSHVGIYLGNDLFIHASSKNRKVTIDSLNSPYYLKRFIGAKRLIPEDAKDIIID